MWIIRVFGYFALGKAMDIAQPKEMLICSVIIYIIIEMYYFSKYLMNHTK
ncbi:hypothetical protein [Clostridium vincentii]|nr:hypothetical protein [Clostridium vincentii]